ncbi:protein RTF1 homolog [Magnolia sinica]|uniref:protein RTF1 homolog n=1 Tax=Magnolia sinica TaxID=86752 RepID=UPI002658D1EA|nr:protein RTF1 homolog [Magnolia sinica]
MENDDDMGSHGDDDDGHGDGSGDDSDSASSIGRDLYKDDADREALAKMSELDREMILSERADKKNDSQLKKKVRASSQSDKKTRPRKESPPPLPARGRSSTNKFNKTAAKDALNELRAKRLKQQGSEGQRRLRVASAGAGGRESSPVRRKAMTAASMTSDSSRSESSRSDSSDEESASGGVMPESDDEGLKSEEEKLTYEDIKDVTIRRSKLAKWFMEPFFEELIVGCFVRVGIGMSRDKVSIYRLCMVRNVDASDPDRQYKLEGRTTHKYLNCIWGNESSAARWQMARVSDSAPTETEFKEWIREIERSGARMPSLQDIMDKKEAIQKTNVFVYSAATVKQMLQEKKSASSRPLNVAAEKNRLRKEMEVAESRRDDAEVERIRARLQELEAMSRQVKEKDAKAVRLAEMNRKNRAENFKNASELKPVNTSLKAGEAGYDPFSRRWTRSRNYYVSKPGGAANGDEGATTGPGSGIAVGAGEAATVAALEAAAGAGKLVDTSAPVDQGTESNTLHDFELPISLAGLQKFGGPQGAHLGFMARKQKIEAAIGFRVPENDGRRHALTLTVGDYKRRRGLL